MSFIDLIEKVPSVIGRFRPFRIIKKDNIEFKNDVDYVRNYFFTQLEQNSCRIHVDSNLSVKPDDTNKCGTHPCIDLNCVSVIETAFRCLSSTHNISMDAHDRNRSGLAYFPNKKYGNLNSSGMREKVRVGHLLFEAPSLKVFKKVHRNAK
jgi:predicted RNA-binding protein with EMAP domain